MSGPELENEAMSASAATPATSDGPPMSFQEKVTMGVIAVLGTTLATLLAFVIKRRSKENNAEDWAWSANQKTIKRLEQELDNQRRENDTLRTQRNEFDAAVAKSHAELEIARNAARAAADALARNTTDVETLRKSWERAQRYIFVLRGKLAEHNIDIPPEPAA
jgi:predicted RNase H-like nuclease (RuvC/YqgF family)